LLLIDRTSELLNTSRLAKSPARWNSPLILQTKTAIGSPSKRTQGVTPMSDSTTLPGPAVDNRMRRLINGCRQQFQYLCRHLDDTRIAVEDLRSAIAAADGHSLIPGEVGQVIAGLSGQLGAASERLPRIDELLPSAVSYDPAELAAWLVKLAATERRSHGRGLTIEYYEPLAAKRYPGISRTELLDAAKQARQQLRK
jgi:hypothetical protein